MKTKELENALHIIGFWLNQDNAVINELLNSDVNIITQFVNPFRKELNKNLLSEKTEKGQIDLIKYYIFEFHELLGFFRHYSKILLEGCLGNYDGHQYYHTSVEGHERKLDSFENYVVISHQLFTLLFDEIQLCCIRVNIDFFSTCEELSFSTDFVDSGITFGLQKSKRLEPISSKYDLTFFTNEANIPNQDLVSQTIQYFENERSEYFEPLTFLNLLWEQFNFINENIPEQKEAIDHLNQLPLDDLEKHILFGFIIKWFGGYPLESPLTKDSVPYFNFKRDLLDIFLNYPGATPEKEFCKRNFKEQNELRAAGIALQNFINNNVPMQTTLNEILQSKNDREFRNFDELFFEINKREILGEQQTGDNFLMLRSKYKFQFDAWLISKKDWLYGDTTSYKNFLTIEIFVQYTDFEKNESQISAFLQSLSSEESFRLFTENFEKIKSRFRVSRKATKEDCENFPRLKEGDTISYDPSYTTSIEAFTLLSEYYAAVYLELEKHLFLEKYKVYNKDTIKAELMAIEDFIKDANAVSLNEAIGKFNKSIGDGEKYVYRRIKAEYYKHLEVSKYPLISSIGNSEAQVYGRYFLFYEFLKDQLEINDDKICTVPFIGALLSKHLHIPESVLNAYFSLVPQPKKREDVPEYYSGDLNYHNSPYRVSVYGAYPLMKYWEMIELNIESSNDEHGHFKNWKRDIVLKALKNYARGFQKGFNSFLPDVVDNMDSLSNAEIIRLKKIKNFAFNWLENDPCFSESIGGGEPFKNWFNDGIKGGYFYKAWYLILDNYIAFEPLFKPPANTPQVESSVILNQPDLEQMSNSNIRINSSKRDYYANMQNELTASFLTDGQYPKITDGNHMMQLLETFYGKWKLYDFLMRHEDLRGPFTKNVIIEEIKSIENFILRTDSIDYNDAANLFEALPFGQQDTRENIYYRLKRGFYYNNPLWKNALIKNGNIEDSLTVSDEMVFVYGKYFVYYEHLKSLLEKCSDESDFLEEPIRSAGYFSIQSKNQQSIDAKKPVIDKFKVLSFEELFINPKLIDQCLSLLRNPDRPLINDKNEFLRHKGAFILWLDILERKKMFTQVFKNDDERAKTLIHNFPGLEISKSLFRQPNKRAKEDFKAYFENELAQIKL